MGNLTIESIANYFVDKLEAKTAEFINDKANKLYFASYSRGTYGKIFMNFIKTQYPIKFCFNGQLTNLAYEITRGMEAKGYKYDASGDVVLFVKIN